MSGIIEKLGITPGPWGTPHFAREDIDCECGCVFGHDDSGLTVCEVFKNDKNDEYNQHYPVEIAKANARLIAAAPEMLMALIELLTEALNNYESMPNAHRKSALKYYADEISVIEKATGKTWEEIKELIK